MFHGSVPGDMRSIISEMARGWKCPEVHVGCSGNFTVERVLHALGGKFTIHGNDVTMYSVLIGRYLANDPMQLFLNPEHADRWGWLEPFIQDPADTVATVLLCTRMLEGMNNDNHYYTRMRAAYRDQWATLHEKTKAKVEATTLRLGGFAAADVVDWLLDVPREQAVICFPPFFSGDYESMFDKLDQLFEWPKPEYPEFDDERREILFERIMDRDEWILGTHIRQEHLDDKFLRGVVQTTNRGVPIFVYARTGHMRVVAPRQPLEHVMVPRLGAEEDVGDRMALVELTGGQFSTLRSQYMNAHIKPGQPTKVYAVTVDGKIIGCYAISTAPTKAKKGNYVYLLSDFPIAPTKYSRLAKLVLYAALSRESQLLCERSAKKRVGGLSTTAFTQNPVSMKYRGLFDLASRKPATDGRNKFQLQYESPFTGLDLQESLAEWKKKHGKAIRSPKSGDSNA